MDPPSAVWLRRCLHLSHACSYVSMAERQTPSQGVSAVNSFAHVWGEQPFKTGDDSKNNPWVAMVSSGEGWHNNHHAFPRSARHGLFPLLVATIIAFCYMKPILGATTAEAPSTTTKGAVRPDLRSSAAVRNPSVSITRIVPSS